MHAYARLHLSNYMLDVNGYDRICLERPATLLAPAFVHPTRVGHGVALRPSTRHDRPLVSLLLNLCVWVIPVVFVCSVQYMLKWFDQESTRVKLGLQVGKLCTKSADFHACAGRVYCSVHVITELHWRLCLSMHAYAVCTCTRALTTRIYVRA